MDAFFLLCMMSCLATQPSHRELYFSRLGLQDTNCTFEATIPQSYFPSVEFLEIDTSCTASSIPKPDIDFMRIALDSSGRLFKIFGCDSSQFSDLIKTHPASIDLDQVRTYGKFCIDLTILYYSEDYYDLPNADSLLNLNKEDTRLWAASEKSFQRTSGSIEKRVRKVCQGLTFDTIAYDTAKKKFVVDYYYWYLASGKLRNISLEIDRRGGFIVRRDSVLAAKLGYYNPVVR